MVIVMVAVGALTLIGTVALMARGWRRVEPGTALVLMQTGVREAKVVIDGGAMVIPYLTKAEVIDLSVKRIVLDRRGKEGLVCRDCIRADVGATFLVRINQTAEDILKVSRTVGCARAADQTALEELFTAKFAEGLKTVARQLDFEELTRERDRFKDQVIAVIGKDLNGYVLDDVAIDHLEQTPIEFLDPGNVLDAQGIKKIKTLTERS
jgi:uncharacterized membrane protein YqiK